MRFKRDVVIDIVCYRKQGHNELDQPMFTQPQMYTSIARMTPVFKKYSQQLIAEGVVSAEEVDALSKQVHILSIKKKNMHILMMPSTGPWIPPPLPGRLPHAARACLRRCSTR